MLPNMGAARIAIAHGIRGYSSSHRHRLRRRRPVDRRGGAAAARRRGRRRWSAACSEAPLFPTLADTFGNARALARGWDDPTAASRPFDRRRNGLVLAEGAGVFVARTGRARRRPAGAAAYAEVARLGRHHRRPPPDHAPARTASGAADCMRRALADAGHRPPADIGYVNAHGTGTKLGDVAESTAIRAVFGAGGAAGQLHQGA